MIVIVGAPRTGTTLLRNILGESSDVFCLPETSYINRYWSARNLMRLLGKKERVLSRALINHCYDPLMRELMSNREGCLETELEKITEINFGSVCNALYICAKSTKYPRDVKLIEKTPRHGLFISLLVSDPKIEKIVVVKRSIYNAVYSNISRGDMRSTIASACAEYSMIYEAAEKYNSNKIVWISYEKLISKPEEEIRRICRFLEINFNSGMLTPRPGTSSFESHNPRSIKKINNTVPKKVVDEIDECLKRRLLMPDFLKYFLKEKILLWLSFIGLRPYRWLFKN